MAYNTPQRDIDREFEDSIYLNWVTPRGFQEWEFAHNRRLFMEAIQQLRKSEDLTFEGFLRFFSDCFSYISEDQKSKFLNHVDSYYKWSHQRRVFKLLINYLGLRFPVTEMDRSNMNMDDYFDGIQNIVEWKMDSDEICNFATKLQKKVGLQTDIILKAE